MIETEPNTFYIPSPFFLKDVHELVMKALA